MLKLLTGDVDSLSGSGGTDFTLWMEYMNGELLSTWGTTLSAMNDVVGLGGENPRPLRRKILPVWVDRIAICPQAIDLRSQSAPDVVLQLLLGGVLLVQ